MTREFRRGILRFVGERAAAGGRRIISSRPARWVAEHPAVRFSARALVVSWVLAAERIWWPAKRLVRRIRKFMGRHELWAWAATLTLCALLAWGITTASPLKVVAAVLGGLFCALVAWRLEFGVIAVVVLVVSFIHTSAIPKPATLGGMGPNAAELLVLFMLVVVFLRCMSRREEQPFKSTITVPLLLLFLAIVVSMSVSYRQLLAGQGYLLRLGQIYNTARPMFYYLLFFVVVWGIRSEKSLKVILNASIVATVVVSALMLVQYHVGYGQKLFVGTAWLTPRVEALTGQERDVTRSLPPGMALMLVLFPATLLLSCVVRGARARLFYCASSVAIGMGLIFTFTRNYWVSMLLALGVMWFLSVRGTRSRLGVFVVTALAMVIIGSVSASKFGPGVSGEKFTSVLSKRFTSTFERSTLRSESMRNRFDENMYAISQIRQHPILGIGVGNPAHYKQWIRPGTWTRVIYPVDAIHNSYLELWMVYGLLGIVSFLWLSIAFLARAFTFFRQSQDPFWRSVALAFFAGYIAFLVRATITMSVLHETYNIVAVSLMWGMVEVLWRLHLQEQGQAVEIAVTSPVGTATVGD